MFTIMSKLAMLLLLVLVLSSVGHARHIHPQPHRQDSDVPIAVMPEIDGMPIEVLRHARPNQFVPINNVIFFRNYEPCEDGLMRDLFGVCREVWD